MAAPRHFLTKEQYTQILKQRRRDFVEEYFGDAISDVFEKLTLDAQHSKPCHREATFTPPDHFDLDKIENILSTFFNDCGYTSVLSPRKEGDKNIVITLT